MSERSELDDILSRIQEDPELRDAFEEGQHSQMAANLITEMREDAGLSKAELAERLGVSAPRIHEAERPKGSQGPTYRFMSQIAAACGFTWPSGLGDLRRIGAAQAAVPQEGAGSHDAEPAPQPRIRTSAVQVHPGLVTKGRAKKQALSIEEVVKIVAAGAKISQADAIRLVARGMREQPKQVRPQEVILQAALKPSRRGLRAHAARAKTLKQKS